LTIGMLITQNALFYFKTLYTKSKSIKYFPVVANLKMVCCWRWRNRTKNPATNKYTVFQYSEL